MSNKSDELRSSTAVMFPSPFWGHKFCSCVSSVVSSVLSGAPVPEKLNNLLLNSAHFALPIVWAPSKIWNQYLFLRIEATSAAAINYLNSICLKVLLASLPDKETTSVTLRPTLTNFETIVSSGSNGEGSAAFARDPFETVPSLRPSGTFHEGPPLYQMLWVI